MDAVYDECVLTTKLADIGSAYLDSIWPSVEEANKIAKDCLVDLGLVDLDMSDEEIDTITRSIGDDDPELAQAISRCRSKPYTQPQPGG